MEPPGRDRRVVVGDARGGCPSNGLALPRGGYGDWLEPRGLWAPCRRESHGGRRDCGGQPSQARVMTRLLGASHASGPDALRRWWPPHTPPGCMALLSGIGVGSASSPSSMRRPVQAWVPRGPTPRAVDTTCGPAACARAGRPDTRLRAPPLRPQGSGGLRPLPAPGGGWRVPRERGPARVAPGAPGWPKSRSAAACGRRAGARAASAAAGMPRPHASGDAGGGGAGNPWSGRAPGRPPGPRAGGWRGPPEGSSGQGREDVWGVLPGLCGVAPPRLGAQGGAQSLPGRGLGEFPTAPHHGQLAPAIALLPPREGEAPDTARADADGPEDVGATRHPTRTIRSDAPGGAATRPMGRRRQGLAPGLQPGAAGPLHSPARDATAAVRSRYARNRECR